MIDKVYIYIGKKEAIIGLPMRDISEKVAKKFLENASNEERAIFNKLYTKEIVKPIKKKKEEVENNTELEVVING